MPRIELWSLNENHTNPKLQLKMFADLRSIFEGYTELSCLDIVHTTLPSLGKANISPVHGFLDIPRDTSIPSHPTTHSQAEIQT